MFIYNILLTALLISRLHSEKCLIDNNDHDYNEFMQNLKYEWTVVIKDITENSNFHLSYGFVLSPQIILTSAYSISGTKAEDLIVRVNCKSSIRHCVIKNVTDIILPFSRKSDLFYKTDFALLVLKKPIPYSEEYTISSKVQLTDDYTRINKSRCFITRWQYEPCPRRYNKLSYDINICEGNLINFKSYEIEKIFNDGDGIIFSRRDDTNDTVTVSFYGSPIICHAVDNYDTNILFGIALFDVMVTVPDKNLSDKMMYLVGTYINLIDKYYDLHQTISEIHYL